MHLRVRVFADGMKIMLHTGHMNWDGFQFGVFAGVVFLGAFAGVAFDFSRCCLVLVAFGIGCFGSSSNRWLSSDFAGRRFFRLVVSLLDLLLLAVAEFLFLRAWLFVAAFLSLRLVWRFVVLVVLPDTNCTTGLLIGSLQVGEVTARMAPVGLALVLDPV